jgi:ENTS family enterobactin (siderophore) exporter
VSTREGGGTRRRLGGLLVDISPLRLDRDYRYIWLGQAISGVGSQVTRIALPYQIFVLTGSTLAVGAIAGVQLIAILLFAMGGGAIADSVDRRRLLLVTQAGLAVSSLGLAALATMASPPLLALFGIAFVSAALGAVDSPARSSSIPRLVPAERLPSAIALNQLVFQATSVIGPAIGGVILGTAGLTAAYLLDVGTYSAAMVAVFVIRPLPPLDPLARASIAAVREGLRFAASKRVILSTFAIDLNAMIFGMPSALWPVLALDVFHAGPAGVGLLAAAPGAGAFVGALLSGWVAGVRRVGRAVIIAVAVWGAAIVAFGLATFSFGLALFFLAIAGAADVLSAVFRSTIVQLETPDALRGRVSALHILVVTSGPRLGDVEAAAVAAVAGAQFSVVSGGLLCLLGVIAVARLFPELGGHVSRSLPRVSGRTITA